MSSDWLWVASCVACFVLGYRIGRSDGAFSEGPR
jgi:hypothetical protein